jgi:hypothetical protein
VRTKRGAIALAALATVAIVVAIGTTIPRAEPSALTASPATTTSIAASPRVLFAHHVVLDTVPGGGAGITSAYDSFEVLAPGGARQSHPVAGVAGTPVFDGRDRVAYWRRGSITRSPLELSGAYDVVVLNVRTDREQVLLTLKDERSNGDLLWSADRKSLVVPTRTAEGMSGGVRSRLLLVDADNGATRVLQTSAADAAIGPLFVDAQVVVGVRGSSYVVLDTSSGALRTLRALRVPPSFMGESAEIATSPDGTVLELLRRFESDSGPLWMWNIRDPSVDIAKVDRRGIWDPIFWPGRAEVVFSAATGLMALDYRSGRTRPLVSPPGVHRIVTVDSSGRFALAQTESGLRILDRTGDQLDARPDLALGTDSLLMPLGLFLP